MNTAEVIQITGATERDLHYWIEQCVIDREGSLAIGRGSARDWTTADAAMALIVKQLRKKAIRCKIIRKQLKFLRNEAEDWALSGERWLLFYPDVHRPPKFSPDARQVLAQFFKAKRPAVVVHLQPLPGASPLHPPASAASAEAPAASTTFSVRRLGRGGPATARRTKPKPAPAR